MPEIEVRAGDDICDFCNEPHPVRMFDAPDFTMDKSPGFPEYRSKGQWAACSSCGTLIDAGNWTGLLQRAVSKLGPKYDAMMPRRVLADVVNRSHTLFREHYKAKP